MRKKRIALLALTVVLVIAAVVRFALRWSGEPVSVAKEIATVSVAPPGDGASRRPFYTSAIDLSADGRVLVAAAQDGSARVWRMGADDRLEQTAEFGPLKVRTGAASLTSLCMTPDARLVACAFAVGSFAKTDIQKPGSWPAETGLVRIWNVEKRSNRTLATLTDPPEVVAISARGGTVAVAQSRGGALRALDGETGKKLWSDSTASYGLEIAFSPDGKLLAACSRNTVRVYEARTGRLVRTCGETIGGMTTVSFSADGARVAAGGVSPNLYVWNVREPQQDVVLPLGMASGEKTTVVALAFEANSDSLVAYLPREEPPGFFENLQHPPPPGIEITHITGSLILRREMSPRGAKTVLLSTASIFHGFRFAQNASRFVESKRDDRQVGVWQF
jgi:WD40 repeat protein